MSAVLREAVVRERDVELSFADGRPRAVLPRNCFATPPNGFERVNRHRCLPTGPSSMPSGLER